MNKNAKIALGCGGAGCLGIIILGVVGVGVYFYTGGSTNRNFNYNSNYNSNNSNANRSTNRNGNQNSAPSSSSPSSNLSDDDKHKLFQAAAVTADAELIRRVNVKLGILNDDFTPGDNYTEFVSSHPAWAIRNSEFILEVSTPAKARAYVEEHIDD